MPLPNCSCEIQSPTCCGWLFADGRAMLDAVYERLVECLPETDDCTGPPLQTFVSHGQPVTAESDYLTVWLEGIRLTTSNGVMRTFEVSWVMLLSESGYPSFRSEGNEPVSPDLDLLEQVNEHVYAHLAKLTEAVGTAWLEGDLLPDRACTKVRLSEVVPAVGGGDVLGGSAGARLRIAYSRSW